jgi:hypothetical protein
VVTGVALLVDVIPGTPGAWYLARHTGRDKIVWDQRRSPRERLRQRHPARLAAGNPPRAWPELTAAPATPKLARLLSA